jgi:hypothetical protein
MRQRKRFARGLRHAPRASPPLCSARHAALYLSANKLQTAKTTTGAAIIIIRPASRNRNAARTYTRQRSRSRRDQVDRTTIIMPAAALQCFEAYSRSRSALFVRTATPSACPFLRLPIGRLWKEPRLRGRLGEDYCWTDGLGHSSIAGDAISSPLPTAASRGHHGVGGCGGACAPLTAHVEAGLECLCAA